MLSVRDLEHVQEEVCSSPILQLEEFSFFMQLLGVKSFFFI